MVESKGTYPQVLLERATRGDQDAAAELLQTYRPYLTLLARLQIGRQLQAKIDQSDLVQETTLLAHRDFHTFRGSTEPEFAAWLRTILAHVVLGTVRHFTRLRRDVRAEQQLRRELDQSSFLLGQAIELPGPSPSQQAIQRERAVILAAALDKLPDDYREVIILRELEGLTLGEIGRRLDRSEDSVRKLWARAVLKMRHLMGEGR